MSTHLQKAFPTAYGGGAYASGGRGGNIYHVTNLLDDGSVGSFRWAINEPRPATVVFDVSGTIECNNNMTIQGANLTIAGQTAPEGGITFTFVNPYDNFKLNGKTGFQEGIENIIIRYIKIRYKKDNNETGIGIYGNTNVARNIIFDHVSLSYAGWTGVGLRGNNSYNVTFQNSLIAECKTGAIFGDSDTNFSTASYDNSFNGNYFYNTSHRFPNPNSMGRVDVINNVIQNPTFRLNSNTHTPIVNHINNFVAAGSWNDLTFARMNRAFQDSTTYNYGLDNQIYSSGNIINKGIFTDPNGNNKLLWSKWNAGSETEYLRDDQFVANMHTLIGDPYPIRTATQSYNDVINNQDLGASKSLNADGTITDSKDANDLAYFAKIAEGEGAFEAYTTGNSGNDRSFFFEQRYFDFLASISATPINTRPSSYYNEAKSADIPEVWFDANVPSGETATDLAPSGYMWIEEFVNEVDGDSPTPPPPPPPPSPTGKLSIQIKILISQ